MRHPDVNRPQRAREQLAILGRLDGGNGSAQDADSMSAQHPLPVQRQATVQRRLPAERQENSVGLAELDHPSREARRHRQKEDAVGEPRRRLNRRDIGIDQPDLDPLLLERLDRLRAGVVEFARLADLERSRPQHQDPHRSVAWAAASPLDRAGRASPAHLISCRNSSRIHSVPVGPGAASGWNCTDRQGPVRCRMPSLVPSLALLNHVSQPRGRLVPSTAKP